MTDDTAPTLFCRTRVRREPDWFDTFIDTYSLLVVREEVQLTPGPPFRIHLFERPPVRSWQRLFRLAHINDVDVSRVADPFVEALPHELGRLSMRLVNLIKISAQRRGGLRDLDREWHPAPDEWLNQQPRTRILTDVPATPTN